MYKTERERESGSKREEDIKVRGAATATKKRQTAYPCFTLPVAHTE